MKKSVLQVGLVLGVVALVASCSTFRPPVVTVPWDTVPVAVQSTILANSVGGTVSKVEKETRSNGSVYQARIRGEKGQCIELRVTEDGKLLNAKSWKEDKTEYRLWPRKDAGEAHT